MSSFPRSRELFFQDANVALEFLSKHAIATVDSSSTLQQKLDVNESEGRADLIVGFLLTKWTGDCERCELRNTNLVNAGGGGGTDELNINSHGSVRDSVQMSLADVGLLLPLLVLFVYAIFSGKEWNSS